ncbi:hypothetical protein CPB83DRAFT_908865 [Crepidotus variabilis]|uniref:Ubiquitin-like protease family profile domain-containing protein n=1 Tax=Crepidotus variabilis TaxID=179855 RepID=A0A9P6EBB4_9AGAR|nr:hypothetical protein CPB83DRAFT_908865 [Crepidotus variabilis]
MSLPSKPAYATVTEELDGALICNCQAFQMTGKPCVHISAAQIQRDYGPVDQYLELETRNDRGPESKGKYHRAKKSTKERRHQARSDGIVDEEIERIMEMMEKEDESDLDDAESKMDVDTDNPTQKPAPAPTLKSKKNQRVDRKADKKSNIGSALPDSEKIQKVDKKPNTGVTAGRPCYTTPLHPTRTPVKFSQKPGPKGKPHNSLLPSLTPLKALKIPVDFTPHKTKAGNGFLSKPIPQLKAVPEHHYTSFELEMANLDFSQWDDVDYHLRQDEIQGRIDILNAISLEFKSGTLVVPDSYGHAALQMESLDWVKADHPPQLLDGAKAVAADTLIGRSWTYSQQATLKQCIVLHYSSENIHWLLYSHSYNSSPREIKCYEPLSKHGRKQEIGKMDLFMKFFDPSRGDGATEISMLKKYSIFSLGLQEDGSSCGFWAITFALLLIFGLQPNAPAQKKKLKAIGVVGLKDFWKKVWTEWLRDEKGLRQTLLREFLEKFGYSLEVDELELYAAVRPKWISQNVPGEAENPISPSSPVHTILERLNRPRYAGIQQGTHNFFINKARIPFDHLYRFEMGEWISDEIMNVWVEIMLDCFEEVSKRKYIFNTYFFKQMREWVQKWSKTAESNQAWKKLQRWYKEINISDLYHCYIPIYLPEEGHWILADVQVLTETIVLYDSWAPTQNKNKSLKVVKDAVHYDILEVLQAWITEQIPLSAMNDWILIPAGFQSSSITPCQDNTIDCGVFVIIYLYHFMARGGINLVNLPNELEADRILWKTKYCCDANNILALRTEIFRIVSRQCEIMAVSVIDKSGSPLETSEIKDLYDSSELPTLTEDDEDEAEDEVETVPDSQGEEELSMLTAND